MKHVIVGTAGHIDHGKTALVRALTGIECDTHREEKQRGITINLGFAHLVLSDKTTVGIVDVPGHRDFIHTMVAGASGIDIALLVVAADGGIMPQTREHMAIMDMLGVKKGMIALTRTDLVDDEIVALALEEIAAFVEGTFLENCPVVPVSSKTGKGLDAMKKALESIVFSVEDRGTSDLFRMYIDRIFTVSGFGTVVTGSVLGGTVQNGAHLYLLPGAKQVRVRRLERYGKEVDRVVGGDRASINCAGLSREEFVRGMLIADRPLHDTVLMDVRVTLFERSPIVQLWSKVQFFIGTFDAQVRMHLIDVNVLRPGEEAIAQLHLPQPCVAQAGDRFVLRSTSNDRTIGGGTIIDAAPLHHRRRPVALVEKLQEIAQGDLTVLLAAEIEKHRSGVSLTDVAEILNCSSKDIRAHSGSLPDDIVTLSDEKEMFFISREVYRTVQERSCKAIAAYHRRNPLEDSGRTIEELQGMLDFGATAEQARLLQLILQHLVDDKKLKQVRHTLALYDHTVDDVQGYAPAIAAIENELVSNGLRAPLETDLQSVAQQQGVDGHMFKQILNYLVKNEKAYYIENTWLHASIVDPIRKTLLKTLKQQKSGLTVAQFRDLIGGNRKICLLLYALFDREGITRREGDVRCITEKGRKMA